jgi:hypothetical protein
MQIVCIINYMQLKIGYTKSLPICFWPFLPFSGVETFVTPSWQHSLIIVKEQITIVDNK